MTKYILRTVSQSLPSKKEHARISDGFQRSLDTRSIIPASVGGYIRDGLGLLAERQLRPSTSLFPPPLSPLIFLHLPILFPKPRLKVL